MGWEGGPNPQPPSCSPLLPHLETMSNNVNIYVGVARLELHIPDARSLKGKRRHIRGLVERIRNRHKVLVMEVDHQNLYQRAAIVVSAISTDPVDVESRLQRVETTVNETWSGHVLGWDVEIIQV
jgi:uncharacterized protein YlxP (DUF503 family)